MQEGATATKHVPQAKVEVQKEERNEGGPEEEEAEWLHDANEMDKEEMKEQGKVPTNFPVYGWTC